MKNEQLRSQVRERMQVHLEDMDDKQGRAIAEHVTFTRMEIALRMLVDNIPDKEIRKYTKLPILMIQSLYGLRDKIKQEESDAKSAAIGQSLRMQDIFP